MDNEGKRFAKGFNHGYFISKYQPKLSEALQATISNTGEYFQGFLSGAREYEIEIEMVRHQDLTKLRKAKNRNRNLDRDI